MQSERLKIVEIYLLEFKRNVSNFDTKFLILF